MALRDKLEERVQPLLEPAEQVQEVWWAQTGPNPNFVLADLAHHLLLPLRGLRGDQGW